jgi:hypothetical protein
MEIFKNEDIVTFDNLDNLQSTQLCVDINGISMLKNIYMDIKGMYIRWLESNYYLKDFKKVLTTFN